MIQHEYFGRPRGAKSIGQPVVEILQDRKCDLVHAGVRGDLRHRVLSIRVDPEELNSLVGVSTLHFRQPRSVQLDQWAFGAEECNDNHALVLVIRKGVDLSAEILEDKVLDFSTDGRKGSRFRAASGIRR